LRGTEQHPRSVWSQPRNGYCAPLAPPREYNLRTEVRSQVVSLVCKRKVLSALRNRRNDHESHANRARCR